MSGGFIKEAQARRDWRVAVAGALRDNALILETEFETDECGEPKPRAGPQTARPNGCR